MIPYKGITAVALILLLLPSLSMYITKSFWGPKMKTNWSWFCLAPNSFDTIIILNGTEKIDLDSKGEVNQLFFLKVSGNTNLKDKENM